MIVKSCLLLLSAASAFANDQVAIGASSACLASSDPNSCCAGGSKTGKISFDDRTFEFTCGSKLQSLDAKSAQKLDNAHACATSCSNDPLCEGSSFKGYGKALRGGNNCLFRMGANEDETADGEWITFQEIQEEDDPNDVCAGGAKSGEVSFGDRTFEFTCGSKLQSLDAKSAQKLDNAHACATSCSNDPLCEGSSFKVSGKTLRGGNNCFFRMGDNQDQTVDGDWITYQELPPSCLENDDPNPCCSDPATTEGVATIDGISWKWTCGSILSTVNTVAKVATSPNACAKLCESENCGAISFRTQGGRPGKGKCYFVQGNNKDQRGSDTFISLVKVVDDEEPPAPDPNPSCADCIDEKKQCDKDLKETGDKLRDCQNNQLDPAKLAVCEKEKTDLQSEKEECERNAAEAEKKRQDCRKDQATCEAEKGTLTEEKTKCEKEKTGLNAELEDQDHEITKLGSQITKLENKLSSLQLLYDSLHTECKGEGPGGKCRTNLVDAEPRDDQCIIPAGSEKFKIYYAKLDDPTGKNLGTPKASSFQDCAEKCANYQGAEKCVRFMWKTDGKDRACYMRSSGGNLTPTTSSLFSSGQIV
ncbi:unnamed protein product [Penicillium bialowiezense]